MHYQYFIEKLLQVQESSTLWSHQKKAIMAMVDFLKLGKTRGLLQHPMGAGKTTVYCSIVQAIETYSLILVPRTGLVSQTHNTLLKLGVSEERLLSTHQFVGTVEEMIRSMQENQVVIMTYQALIILVRTAPETYHMLLEKIQFLVVDEGHTALGSKTQMALNELRNKSFLSDDLDDVVDDVFGENFSLQDVDLVRNALANFHCFELFVTATPFLLRKNVQEIYGLEIIHHVRYEELAKEGILIVPQIICPGEAIAEYKKEKFSYTQKDLDRHYRNFVMSDGRGIYEAVLDEYSTMYHLHGQYLPAVAFCISLAECETFIAYAKRKYRLRAVRCTGGNVRFKPGVSLEEATALIEENKVDIIVTVNKAALGWDIPTLRAAIVTHPTLSSAKYIQGPVGRIGRNLFGAMKDQFHEKTRENTLIIEPSWNLVVPYTLGTTENMSTRDSTGSIESRLRTKKTTLFQGYMHLYHQGELTKEGVWEYFGKNVLDFLPRQFFTKEDWIKHFSLFFSPEKILSMTNIEALEWKDSITGFGFYKAAILTGIIGNACGIRKDRLHFGVSLFPEHKGLRDAYEFACRTKEEWIIHYAQSLSPEKLLFMKKEEADIWKDPVTGEGLIAIAGTLGINDVQMRSKKYRVMIGMLLFPENKEVQEAYKYSNFTREEWIRHFSLLWLPDIFISTKMNELNGLIDPETGYGINAAYTKVSGIQRGDSRSLHRDTCLHFGTILFPEHVGLKEAYEMETRTEQEWVAYFASIFLPTQLLLMTHEEAASWKDEGTENTLYTAHTKIGGKNTVYENPYKSRKTRLYFGTVLFPEDIGLKEAYEIECRTKEEWILYFQSIFTPEQLATMTNEKARLWKDEKTKMSIKIAYLKVGGKGNLIGYKKHRLLFGLILFPENQVLLKAMQEYL